MTSHRAPSVFLSRCLPRSTRIRSRPMPSPPLPVHRSFSPSSRPTTTSFCRDVWGVVHNGVAAVSRTPATRCVRFRAGGGTVVLITNAPRPSDVVDRPARRASALPRDAYDDVVTSGDVTRARDRPAPRRERVSHRTGPRPLDLHRSRHPLSRRSRAPTTWCARASLTTTSETPDDYRDLPGAMRARDLFMVCANPDLVVERGDRCVYCAGAIADLYASLGGRGAVCRQAAPADLRAGARSRGRAAARTTRRALARVLAIGDSVRTDLTGAAALGRRLPVRHRRHSCRGARHARQSRRVRARHASSPPPASRRRR